MGKDQDESLDLMTSSSIVRNHKQIHGQIGQHLTAPKWKNKSS